jgi:hypothetical protein
VNYTNAGGCYATVPTTFPVTVNSSPEPAGLITGASVVFGGAQGVVYSCAPIPGTVYYVWTLPAGATIATGAGTNSIIVNFDANSSSGVVTVCGNNLCGNGAISPGFPVTVTSLPAAAGTIAGSSAVCQGANEVTYSVNPIANSSTYHWSVPEGASVISGSTTHTISVSFSMSAVSGNVTVYGSNICGDGTLSPPFPVTVNQIPTAPVIFSSGDTLWSSSPTGNQWYFNGVMVPSATGQTYTPSESGWYWDAVTINDCTSDTSNHIYITITSLNDLEAATFNIYPVPNNGLFKVLIDSPGQTKSRIEIYNTIGIKIYQRKEIQLTGKTEVAFDLRPLPSGIYTFVLTNDKVHLKKSILVIN